MEIVTLAFVIRSVNFREADRMLTLFSVDHGIINAMAKGCRTQKSPLRQSTELFVCSEFTLFKRGEKYYIKSAVPREHFYHLRNDISALSAAAVMIDACSKVVQPEQPEKAIFNLLAHCLNALNKKDDIKSVFCFFVMKLQIAMGTYPVFSECVRCGSTAGSRFSFDDNGLLCENCGGGEELEENAVDFCKEVPKMLLKDCGKADASEALYDFCKKLLINSFGIRLHGMDLLPE